MLPSSFQKFWNSMKDQCQSREFLHRSVSLAGLVSFPGFEFSFSLDIFVCILLTHLPRRLVFSNPCNLGFWIWSFPYPKQTNLTWKYQPTNYATKNFFFVSSDSDSGEQVEITQVERMWVQRCRNSAIFVSSAWVVWVLLVQVFLSEYFPDSLFVAQDNTGEATGW